jgi:hypothetical protein
MAALTAIVPANAGTASAGAAVAASDTVAATLFGNRGAYLEIINAGGSVDNVTISDHGVTPAGNALSGNTIAGSVTNGTSKVFYLRVGQENPATGLVTITHSFTTSVTYKLYPVPA